METLKEVLSTYMEQQPEITKGMERAMASMRKVTRKYKHTRKH
ncbi:hypothetical protein [Prevotella heparinolytica]|nr:hypothetical protein [Bacteroides heparinolyticus]